jgi:large subunit ribosomal protein L23Ae
MKIKTILFQIKYGVCFCELRKIRTSVHFYRPKTLALPRAPKYPRKSVPRTDRYKHWFSPAIKLTTTI